jgi:hypothetical protein
MSERIASIVPTMGRPETHESLYATFAAQDWDDKILIVLDESAEPSPFFSQLQDPRVGYVHEPAQGKREVTRIGAVRNRLCELARKAGAVLIAHQDDDDHYAANFLSQMRAKLGDGQLAKLAVFRLLVDGGEAAGTIWQWDVRSMSGRHYALMGDTTPEGPIDVEPGEDPRYEEAMRYGYGFSYLYRADLQAKYPFPEEGTEDYPWVRTLRENGIEVVEVDDFADGCLHVVHAGSASMVWPQEFVGQQGLAGAPCAFRDFVRFRMLGALPAMYEIAKKGKSFMAEPGVTYSIVAKIAKKHTLKSVTTRAESWGLVISAARDNVDGAEFDVKPVPDDYRLVHVVGTSKERMEIPWRGNKLISLMDKSCIERAWQDAPTDASYQVNAQLTPAAPAPAQAPAGVGRCFLDRRSVQSGLGATTGNGCFGAGSADPAMALVTGAGAAPSSLPSVALSPFMRTVVGKNVSTLVRPGGPAQPIMMPAPAPPTSSPSAPTRQLVLDVNGFANTFRSVFRGTGLMVAGYSVQINVEGQLTWQDTYGWAQTPAGSSPGIPWTPSTRQNLASCSKLLTSMCMARMCQQYNLNPFTTTMSQFLPGYWKKGANVDKITLAQLLTHTSGFPNQDAEIGNMKAMVAQSVGSQPQPRVYCNAAFGLMRFIISNVMGGVTDQAVAAMNGGSGAASDSLWDYLAISAYEYCMKAYVFVPSGVSSVSTVHGPSDALAYNVSAYWTPSNTVPLAGMTTKNTPGWLSASGYNDGDMGWTVGASGWHLSVNEALKCMSTFRRTSAIVTPYWSQLFITNGFALDLVQQVEPGQSINVSNGMFAKGGYNGDSGNGSGLRGEQSAAYFLPNDMELAVLCNSIATPVPNSGWIAQSDGTGVSVTGVTTSICVGALGPAITSTAVPVGTRTATAPPVVAPARAHQINAQLTPRLTS